MKLYKYLILPILVIIKSISPLYSQTIAEKKAGLEKRETDLDPTSQKHLERVNAELTRKNAELRTLFSEVREYYRQNAPASQFEPILKRINTIRNEIIGIQEEWRHTAVKSGGQQDLYALWHQPETTVEQLVIDYGSQDYVYLIPEDVADISLSVTSNIPIPRASWMEMLDEILIQNGIGIKQLNPFLRELYLLKDDRSGVKIITNNRNDLEIFPPDAKVSFVLSPQPADVRRSWYFLEKFVNPESTVLQLIGRDILIVGRVIDVKELMKIYDFVSLTRGDKEYKVIPLRKVDPKEMVKILDSIFGEFVEEPEVEQVVEGESKVQKKRTKPSKDSGNGLKVFDMGEVTQSIFLVGTAEEIARAEEIIKEVEGQIGQAREKVIYRYQVKHSEAEEMAKVLEKIYTLMIQTGTGKTKKTTDLTQKDLNHAVQGAVQEAVQEVTAQQDQQRRDSLIVAPYQTPLGFGPYGIMQGYMPVNAPFVEPTPPKDKKANQNRNNFIVDVKTNAIVMVVEAEILPKLKELIRKLDVPKKMVQIDVMLFEKRLDRDTNFGLNLLRLGTGASGERKSEVNWNDKTSANNATLGNGLFQFLVSRVANGAMPAYDLIYNFLISQTDISLNQCPSVLAVNQTPATISIIDEISINVGTQFIAVSGTNIPERVFERRQYGITITVTPTIHSRDFASEDDVGKDYEEYDSVTLDTDIIFDTIRPGLIDALTDRPEVNRRKVKNEVRIPDGQSVIIGGLRSKQSTDTGTSIPFLGEIPGLGKLFSTSALQDKNIELFIFITPKIINDPKSDLLKVRRMELCKRPGDIPEYLCRLNAALNGEKYRAFQGTLTYLFGRMQDRCICTEGEWNGR